MKKLSVVIAVLVISLMAFSGFASNSITLGDVNLIWLKPSDIGAWSTSWMLPVLYETASNTTVANAYGDFYSDKDGTVGTLGGYAFSRFFGIDYLNSSIKTSYTTFGINRVTLGIAVPNAGFDIRYMNVKDGSLNYFDEVGFDVEYATNHPLPMSFFRAGSSIYSFVKIYNMVRYIRPAYPEGSDWKQVFSLDYMVRTMWLLPDFAVVYDQYTGLSQLSFSSTSYEALEILYKVFDPLIARVGITFADSGPVPNVGASFSYHGLNFNVGYEFGDYTNFAASIGGRF